MSDIIDKSYNSTAKNICIILIL